MGTWIAEDIHHKRASGHNPYPAARERELRCEVPALRMPDDLHGDTSEREDAACHAERLQHAQEAFVAYALAICDKAVDDENVSLPVRLCLAELARQGRDLQQWGAEMEGRLR